MDILISVTAKIAEYTVEPVGRQLGYVFFIRSNFQKLKTQVEKLKITRESVQHKIHSARRNAEDIKPAVEEWLKKVDDFVRESDEILANEGGHGGLCSTYLVQRHKLSRKASKMVDEVLEMKNEGESFDMVSYKSVIPSVDCSLPKVPDFLDFESRKSIMEQIMDALSDGNVHRIGVYGMGGVGKTMLVKDILRKIVESKKPFDEVVTSTISQTPDFRSIQGQLADKLGLKFEQETIEGRATILRKRLKMERSILVVLDDVWEYIDLETIGIPSVEDHTGCKILFTTRIKHLISNQMCANKIFEIKVLGKDESWNLFKAMAGDIVDASDLKPIAIRIVRECAGLPIAITTVAKALRNKPSDIWNDALDQLKTVDVGMANIGEMEKKVYLSLKLSYDCLGYEEVKLLFLLCSMFPEDFSIDVEGLHVYAMGMGFLHGVDTVVKGRRRIKKLVDDLISSSLLQQYSEYGCNYVKMHDMVRDVALLIASKNEHVRTLSYVKRSNEEWEEEKLLGNHTAVFIDGLHYPLPKLTLPKVQLLRLVAKYCWEHNKRVSVVETFFEEMKELKGLVVENVNISLMQRPSDVYSLANIRVLRLERCQLLGSIDWIGELKKLEILDFSESNITQIPTTMSQLTQLKVLNLSSCEQLEVIPPNILSKLTKLEELDLETFDGWEGEEWYEGRKNASLSELKCLRHLYALNLTIQDEEIMPENLFLVGKLKLQKFNICIGCESKLKYTFAYKNRIKNFIGIKMESGRCLDDWIKNLLKRSDNVLLEGSVCSKVLHSELVSLPNLEKLEIVNAKSLKMIWSNNVPILNSFSKLEEIKIYSCNNLQKVLFPPNMMDILTCLKVLEIKNCDLLEGIFEAQEPISVVESNNLPILNSFSKLEEIRIWSCNNLQKVLFPSNMMGILPCLKVLDIRGCELLEGIFEVQEPISVVESNSVPILNSFSKLEKIRIWSCNNLQKILFPSNMMGILTCLKVLEIRDCELLEGIFEVQEPISVVESNNLPILNSFSKLEEIRIGSCNNLQKVLFPPNMMGILTCLKVLEIRHCNLLEGIFEVQEPISIVEASPILLQNLSSLMLCNLPNLEYVWSKNPYELLSLENIKSLTIDKCPRLRREYSVKILKQLEDVSIDIKQLMKVIEKEKSAHHNMLESKQWETSSSSKDGVLRLGDGSKLFPNLKSLKLYGFVDYNSTHLPMEMLQILFQLVVFELEGAFLEEIFPSNILIPSYMVLRRLALSKLPKLKHLWSEECSQNNITSVLQHLISLRISECGRLSSLLSSIVCFTNLKHLRVYKCDGLTHLLNPSVATTLVQLESLTIEECKRMSSVIEGGSTEEDGNDEMVVFNNLQHLYIFNCSNLTSFYCGRCIIKFPCLRQVDIWNCSEMKVFSLGIVSTPRLKYENFSLKNDYDDERCHPKYPKDMLVEDMNVITREYWEDNVDTGIPNLFAEQSLEENRSENSSSSKNNVEKE
uniref:Vat protein n=2 Tax=Cucumis melo TaxID=3656 RepID=A0A097NYY2_CUCME|nr:vat protein [Cucumis melo]